MTLCCPRNPGDNIACVMIVNVVIDTSVCSAAFKLMQFFFEATNAHAMKDISKAEVNLLRAVRFISSDLILAYHTREKPPPRAFLGLVLSTWSCKTSTWDTSMLSRYTQ